MKKEEVESLFNLAGIKILNMYELMNEYWPRHSDYYKIIIENPWWLVKTEKGFIKIGWRKRVIEINWENIGALESLENITEDDVTKGDTYVHAWGIQKALEYLTNLKNRIFK